MNHPSFRVVRFLGVVVGLLLLALAFYPGTYAGPYDPALNQYAHAVAPESSETYQELVEAHEPSVYQYDDLSPTAQELVDRTIGGQSGPATDWHRYSPDVCRDFTLVCDGYRVDELPAEFAYGEELPPQESLVVIEDGDDRYLLRTGDLGHGDGFADLDRLVSVLTMIPLGIFVTVFAASPSPSAAQHRLGAVGIALGIGLTVGASAAGTRWMVVIGLAAALVGTAIAIPTTDRLLVGIVGGGTLVALLGLFAPYIEMVGLADASTISAPVLIGVWMGLIGASAYVLYRFVSERAWSGPASET